MATNETATEPVEEEQVDTRNRHASSEPVDDVQTLDDTTTTGPKENRHASSEPAD